jgi:acetyltransferase-like isoleucine patch superfamily enzyme
VSGAARAARSLRNRSREAACRIRGLIFRTLNRTLVSGGRGLRLGQGVEFDLYETIRIGSNVFVSSGASLSVRPGGSLVLGDDVFVGRTTVIVAAERIDIGSRVLIGEHCTIRDGDHQATGEARRNETELRTSPVVIGAEVWIGAGARILRGAEIGQGAVVGANSVVRKPVPPNVVVAGAPARNVGPA